jgi:hypothetical protein
VSFGGVGHGEAWSGEVCYGEGLVMTGMSKATLPLSSQDGSGSTLMIKTKTNRLETIGSVSDGGNHDVELALPYAVSLRLQESTDFLFHRWNNDAVAAKNAAAKGSKAKKTDNIESYVYRADNGNLAIPGEYLRSSIIGAAKFKQDPRSPRKSAQDLFKAGVVSMTLLADLGVKDWDYLDRRRVLVQRSAIMRIRPAIKTGWKAEFVLSVLVPEYISEEFLREMVGLAGRLIGLGDFRPTFGRFDIIEWRLLTI